ncbi:MAG TPA: hypothetical protein P5027_11640 [Flavobacteriales bacterium]|nr:hypothetical protein [Flavobacteriales bacterium]
MRPLHSLFALLAPAALLAQVSHGGSPYGWGQDEAIAAPASEVSLSPLDRAALVGSDALDAPGQFRYGVPRQLNVDVLAEGSWTDLPDDRRMCRLVLRSPGAVMLSLQFGVFDMAPESRLFLYDEDRTHFLGGFTEANEQPTGDLPTAVVPGDALVIEYVEPVPALGVSRLVVSGLTHGYRDIFAFGPQGASRDYDPGYQSAACHNNIICPEGNGWEDQASAVAMFLRPDGNGCTGALLNNTAEDGTPYFHVANHCYTATESQWVFYFNYESPTCVGSTGPTTDVLTGATVRASDYFDDFVLLELFNTPPPSYDVFYLGWDRSGNTPQSTTVIHHPLYDVKKISFDDDPATSYQVTPYQGAPQDTYLWRTYWDDGIVQAVSSGSPALDQNKRMVGHMWEGAQTCSNSATVYTGFAKFDRSWNGSSPANRLRDWLDPSNSTTALDGFDPNGQPSPPVLVQVRTLLGGCYDPNTGLHTDALRAAGMVPLTEPYTAAGFSHVGGGGNESTSAGVLATTGPLAVTDWVVLELRDANDPTAVVATRSALLLRNGNVVDVDGSSAVAFAVPPGDHYIAVRHRNHLGLMTQNPQMLSTTPSLKDLRSMPLFGGGQAAVVIDGQKCLWPGDVTGNGVVAYSGGGNDRDAILSAIGGVVPTQVVQGYYAADANLDGSVRYAGTNNDRDLLLQTVGGTVPTATRSDLLP